MYAENTFCRWPRDFVEFPVSLPSCALAPDTNWTVAIGAWRTRDSADRRLWPNSLYLLNWPRRRWRECRAAAEASAVPRSATSQESGTSRCSLLFGSRRRRRLDQLMRSGQWSFSIRRRRETFSQHDVMLLGDSSGSSSAGNESKDAVDALNESNAVITTLRQAHAHILIICYRIIRGLVSVSDNRFLRLFVIQQRVGTHLSYFYQFLELTVESISTLFGCWGFGMHYVKSCLGRSFDVVCSYTERCKFKPVFDRQGLGV